MECVAAEGMATREQIERRVGLKASSLTKLVEELRGRGLVDEGEAIQLSGRGRPTRPIVISRKKWAIMGISMDRHQIVAALSFLDLNVISKRAFPVKLSKGWKEHVEVLVQVASWVAEVTNRISVELISVEIGVPGSVNRATGEVHRSVINDWGSFNLVEEFRKALSKSRKKYSNTIAISIDRSTNFSMFATLRDLSNYPHDWDLSAEGPTAYFGGVYALSGGMYDKGIIYGVSGLAGDYGHMVVDPNGELCWCGRTGCLETKVGLAKLYEKHFNISVPLTKLSAHSSVMIAELQHHRDSGDTQLLKSLEEAGQWLATSINTIAAVANPSKIVIDGYLARLGEPLMSGLNNRLEQYRSFPPIRQLKVEVTEGNPSQELQGVLTAALFTVVQSPILARHS